MNDETPEPFDTIGDEPIEARIVAWVLGEASAFEAAELERLCEERPELLVFRRRMRALHGLLTDAEASEEDQSWKLPEEKRRLLDEIFGEEKVVRLDVERERVVRRGGRRAMLAIAACVMLALVMTRLIPSKYESEAIIEIKPRSAGASLGFGTDRANAKEGASEMTANFFGTEFEKIKSSESLGKVVDRLALTDKWKVDKEDAIKILKDSVNPQNIRGTDLISIRVKDANEQDAKQIAHEVAMAYKDYRTEIDQRDSNKALYELNKAVRDQEDKVEERRKVLATIVRSKGIIYKGQDSFYGQSGVNEDQAARGAVQTYDDLATQKMQLESQIDSLQKYDKEEQLRYASGLDLPENIVKNLYPQYLQAKREAEDLKINGVGERHPRTVAASENINAMKRQLDEGVANLRSTLQVQLETASDRLKNVETMKADTHEEAIKRGLDAQDYVDAKRDYETDQQLLQTMKLEQINKTITGKMAPDSIVVHEDPAPWLSRTEVKAIKTARTRPSASAAAAPAEEDKAMSMSLAKKSKETLSEARQREQLAAGRRTAEPAGAVAGEPALQELADSPPMESAPQSPNTRAAGGFGGGMGMAGGSSYGLKADGASQAASPEPAADALAKNNADTSRGVSSRDRQQGQHAAADMESESRAGMNLGRRFDDSKSAFSPEAAVVDDSVSPGYGTPEDGYSNRNEWADNLTTNGLRSGDQAINRDEIDAILNDPNCASLRRLNSLSERKDVGKVASGKAEAEGGEAWEKMPTLAAKDAAAAAPAEPQTATTAPPAVMAPTQSAVEGKADLADKEFTAEVTKSLEDGHGVAPAKGVKPAATPPIPTTPPTLPALGLNMEMPSNGVFAGKLLGDSADGLSSRRGTNLRAGAEQPVPQMDLLNPTGALSQPIMGGTSLFFESKSFPNADQESDWYGEIGKADSTELGRDLQPGFEPEYFFKTKALKAEQPAKKPSLAELMEEVAASDEPYSTFSLNISDASFQLAKAALAKGERPDPESVKPEQFYNAVDYGDPAPTAAEPVAATIEQCAHPIIPGRNLVRVALRTASTGRSAVQPLRLTLLVDQSGSMVREDRRAAMDHALKQLGVLLTKNDVVTIVGFSRTPHLLADGLTGDQAGKLGDIINQTASEGGTNLEEAMKLGAQKAAEKQTAGAQNRIVLFTDGAANLGNANRDHLAKQVTELRQKGIAFDIAGIGADGLNDKLLGELARHGNGRYYVVGKEKNDSFAKQLAGAFRPAAENVKVQVNFNPQRVGRYKLIGFEKDRLKTEDFRNDSVDAAELAADEAGVAIYQVETLPEGTGEIGEVSVRFRDVARGEMVERTWTIPNEDSATAFDRATPSMQLAGLSLLAAEKLKGGPMGDAIDFKLLAEPAAAVKQFYGASAPAADMLQVIEKLK